MKKFIKICRMNQKSLKNYLEKMLKKFYPDVINEDGFLYAKGSDILLTAHLDTVHKETCTVVKIRKEDGNTILSSPQGIGGDDRCGVWIIYNILTKTKYRPSILFCEDEEIGGVGSSKFVCTEYINDLTQLKYLIELDRANANDAVYYSCGNTDFQNYISEMISYEISYGSFSDISHLSPECDVASVNLSCGYYKAHTLDEYVIYEEMLNTFEQVKVLLKNAELCAKYDYQEEKYAIWNSNMLSNFYYNRNYKESYGEYKEGYDEGYTEGYTEGYNDGYNDGMIEGSKSITCERYVVIYDSNKGRKRYITIAKSIEEAIGKFVIANPEICYDDIITYYSEDEDDENGNINNN